MTDSNPLLLNVGFIIHQTVGYVREFPFDFERIFLPPDTELTNLRGVVRVTRTAQGLLLQGNLQAEIKIECGRCLVEFLQPLRAEFIDLYAFTQNSVTESGLILPENGKINLAPTLRDEMLLSVPINPVCRADCKGLCPVCGENLNESDCEHHRQEGNPSQDQLRSLPE